MNNNPDKNPDKNQPNQPKKPWFEFQQNRFALIVFIAVIGLLGVIFLSRRPAVGQEIPYSQFLSYLNEDQISSVRIVDQQQISGILKNGQSTFRTFIPYFDDSLVALLTAKGISFSGEPKPVSIVQIIFSILPWLFFIFLFWFMFRQVQSSGNRTLSFGRSSVRRYHDDGKKITFQDVAGSREAKFELEEIVDFLKEPERFSRLGARIPKGVLLVGMPGTGKTLLARATAGQAGVAFFHMSGSDFVEMFVGVGASRVRDLFSTGRRNSPCVLFIDELDAVGRTRGAGYGGGHDEREQTLNQMLVEMDGFEPKTGVIVLAATNRPDVLDPALLRPGRFDRQVYVDLPDQAEREEILTLHAKKLPIDKKTVDFSVIARAMPGVSGADLANLVNEAALFASRRQSDDVAHDDFEEARDKIMMGLARKSRIIGDEEKMKTARHEAGHALLHYHLPHADPLHKVTIVPRGRSLGAAYSLPEKDNYSRGKNYLLDRIKICYGGYVAEKIYYQETSTGVQADLKQATEIARKMVLDWGMGSLGVISFGQEDEPIFLGKEIATHKDYSENTAQEIDKSIKILLTDCYAECEKILMTHQKQLDVLSDGLFKEETLSGAQIKKLLGLKKKKNTS